MQKDIRLKITGEPKMVLKTDFQKETFLKNIFDESNFEKTLQIILKEALEGMQNG